MRIILADPPNDGGWRIANHPNLGVLYLSAYLKQTFQDVELVYLEQHLTLKEHVARAEEFQPDLYGISFATCWAGNAERTVREVAKRVPNARIVCGGPHPSAAPDQVARMEGVEACVIGEGEETLCDLVRHFLQGTKDLSDIPGIAYDDGGTVRINRRRPLFRDLDALPLPDWDLIDFTNYLGNYQYRASPSTAMIISRGCAFDCNFCSNPVWNTSKPWVRMRGPENICKEITLLYKKGIRDIYIRSDEANVTSQWFTEVAKAIESLGYRDLYFQCNMRATHVTNELAYWYSRLGGWLVYLGIESGNQRTIDGIGKGTTLDGVVQTCRTLKKYGVDIFGLFMMYHVWEKNDRLCYESYEDVDNTLRFIRRLRKEGLLDYISFTTTTPMPGSRLWHTAIKYDLIDPDAPIKDLSSFAMAIPNVTNWQMKKSRLKGMLMQLWFVLRSGNTRWSDWGKLRIKIKYLLQSLVPVRSRKSVAGARTASNAARDPTLHEQAGRRFAAFGKTGIPSPDNE